MSAVSKIASAVKWRLMGYSVFKNAVIYKGKI